MDIKRFNEEVILGRDGAVEVINILDNFVLSNFEELYTTARRAEQKKYGNELPYKIVAYDWDNWAPRRISIRDKDGYQLVRLHRASGLKICGGYHCHRNPYPTRHDAELGIKILGWLCELARRDVDIDLDVTIS